MSTFYKPIPLTISKQSILLYPMIGVENLIKRNHKDGLENHLKNLYQSNPKLSQGAFHIVILWNEQKDLMTDVWLFLQLESEEAGYTIDCQTYRGVMAEKGKGITASDGLIMLGKEAELSEQMRQQNKAIKDYIYTTRPLLPPHINPTQSFYQ